MNIIYFIYIYMYMLVRLPSATGRDETHNIIIYLYNIYIRDSDELTSYI